MRSMTRGDYQIPPLRFALLTFLVTWISWGAILVANQYGYLPYGSPPMMALFAIGGVSPAIIAVLLLLKTGQSTGKELCKRIFDFRQPLRYYLIVICVAVLLYAVPLWLGRGTQIEPLYMAVVLLPFSLIGGGLEEIGWRFIFQPALEKKLPFAAASLVTGLVWALWHLPLFLMEGAAQQGWSFIAFAIYVIGMAFFLAALYRVSGSVLLCILFHTLSNAVGEVISVRIELGTALGMCAALVALAFLLLQVFGRRKLLPGK